MRVCVCVHACVCVCVHARGYGCVCGGGGGCMGGGLQVMESCDYVIVIGGRRGKGGRGMGGLCTHFCWYCEVRCAHSCLVCRSDRYFLLLIIMHLVFGFQRPVNGPGSLEDESHSA